MRKVFSVITFTLICLLVGRNLSFLPRFELFTNEKKEAEKIQKEISEFTKKQKGNYSVYYVSLSSDASFGIQENQIYTAASVNKVPIVAALYYLANKGKIDLDENITLQKEDIQDYGTGSLRYQKPGTQYSLKTLAKLALNQSDNTAAYILANKIGMNEVQKIMNQLGLKQTEMNNNKTSLSDMYVLYKKIYTKELTNEARTKELLGFMKDTDFEDRLAPGLPKGSIFYHKTGDEVGIVHDVGIVENKDSTFFIGVLTSEVGDSTQETKNAIKTIAEKIINFEKTLQ